MRRLFLHIGAHKTGTTALQHSLHQNRVLLGAVGAAFVSAQSVPHLHPYLGPRSPGAYGSDGFKVLDLNALADRLAAADHDMVIASSENFSFFFHKQPIEALESALRPHFDEIRILCYLRRQDRHAVSHHQEGAKPNRQAEGALWGHAPNALPDRSPGQDLYLDYDRRLGLWAEVFGADKLDLRVYDRELLKDGDIFADVLSVIGLDVRGLAPVGDRNVSLGAGQTKLGHLMNSLNIRPRMMDAILTRIGSAGRLMPSRAEAVAYLDRYRPSNRRLNARFGITALPDLFDDAFDDYPTSPQSDWTEAGANAALIAALSQLNGIVPAPAALTADDLRDAAVAVQAKTPDVALRLITAAHALRPAGPAIVKLKAELERKLTGS